MDILFVAINAKFIHTAPAVRILNKVVSRVYSSNFIEVSIKDRNDNIMNKILSYQPRIVGFSCYIWNIKQVLEIAKLIKEINPKIAILLGGPEVSYECDYFINFPQIDYIIANEAEDIIVPFIKAVLNHEDLSIFLGVASKSKLNTVSYCVNNLATVPSIIDTYTEDDLQNRIIYYETSRGCPFNCSYCLSSIEKGVRAFKVERIYQEIDELIKKGAKNIKFLDRTFNFNPSRFLQLVKFLEQYQDKLTFQFEITLDLFTEEIIQYFTNEVTPSLFRFEIGIQSIHEIVNHEIDRLQNKNKLFSYINRLMQGGRVVLHLDLIAGLPYETYDMFQITLNETIKLFPHELQLGFLKMLRGTKIRKDASKYAYKYDENPPYEVIENEFITKEELYSIHLVEHALNIYYNSDRAREIIMYLINRNLITSPFVFLLMLGQELSKKQIIDAYDYYQVLAEVLRELKTEGSKIRDLLVYSYLTNYPIRPRNIYNSIIDYEEIFTYLKSVHNELNKSHKLFISEYQQGYLVLHYMSNQVFYYYIERNNEKYSDCQLLLVKNIK